MLPPRSLMSGTQPGQPIKNLAFRGSKSENLISGSIRSCRKSRGSWVSLLESDIHSLPSAVRDEGFVSRAPRLTVFSSGRVLHVRPSPKKTVAEVNKVKGSRPNCES